mgnify:CR=1 FL=1
MTSSQLEKRLTAVFAAEAMTIGTANSLRMEVWLGILGHYKTTLASQIKRAGGKVIGRSQTAILAEFDTIVHAVDCGLKFQHSVLVRNRGLPPENRVFFRLGLHVGEIILGVDALTGYGVQIATQLVANTPPGGILISGQAYDLIANLKKEFVPSPGLVQPDEALELRVYAKSPDENPYSEEEASEEQDITEPEDVTVLDLSTNFVASGEATTIIGDPLAGQPSQVEEAPSTASEETIMQIEALLQKAKKNAENTNYYQALQDYEAARELAEILGQAVPERQSFYLDRLREDTIALENTFAFEGDAVVESLEGPYVVRLASALEIGRGSEGAVVGCGLVSRTGGQTRVSIENDLFQITDLGSTNGTFVDGRCLNTQETHAIPANQETLIMHLGGSRSPASPGPVCVSLRQIRGEWLALLLQFSPSKNHEQVQLSTVWPSMATDSGVTYVFSNGPVLIGNCDNCAVRLTNGGPDALARMELDQYYRIAPFGTEPLKINQIDFVHPVALSDRTDIEIMGLHFEIHARHLQAVSN